MPMQIVQQKVYTSVGQQGASLKRTSLTQAVSSISNTGERDGRAAREEGRQPSQRAARMHRDNQLLSHCLTPPIPQGHLAEGTSPDEGQHGDHHHENARQRWSRSAQKQNCQKWQKEPWPKSGFLLVKLEKPTGSKVVTPPPSHLQKSGLSIRPTCIVHPIEMDE